MRKQLKTSHKVLEVGRYFIHLANQEKKPITNKKLQKLVYYAQVWSLVINKEKLFNEPIEAWVHGPAVPTLYRMFKQFEFNPIVLDTSKDKFDFSKEQKRLLDDIYRVYGKYTSSYLEALTHSELPWQEARVNLSSVEPSSNKINLKTARDYYAGKLRANKR